MAVLLVDDDLFLEHVAPPEHPERQARLVAVRQGLEAAAAAASGLGLGRRWGPGPTSGYAGDAFEPYTRIQPSDATDEQLSRVHDPAYIESLGHLAGRSGYLDSDTYVSPRSVPAAFRAAGSVVDLVSGLHAGEARFGIALPRPPGHHALADRAMGFCLLNNVAVGAAHARALGHERVLVLDWDVHHGNGTEAMFYDDPSVLFISLHQFPNYPGTGAISDQGRGEGRGKSVNLPLPSGGTDDVYRAAFERIVLPIVEQFAPTLALVSCGFDAHERDPLAQMRLSAAGYEAMTRSLIETLPERCPLGIVLEGGYDLEALSDSSAAVAGVLLGDRQSPALSSAPGDTRLPGAHRTALDEIHRAQLPFWKLG